MPRSAHGEAEAGTRDPSDSCESALEANRLIQSAEPRHQTQPAAVVAVVVAVVVVAVAVVVVAYMQGLVCDGGFDSGLVGCRSWWGLFGCPGFRFAGSGPWVSEFSGVNQGFRG